MDKKPTYEELKKRIQQLEQAESNRNPSEKQLIHSHDLMDYIISHARSAIAVFDRELKYIYVSKRYLTDYKVKEQHVIGKHHYEVFPDLPQKWKEVHQKSLAGEVLSAEEDPYYREDGSVHWTRWESRPWYDSDGSIGGIIIYNEIINEWKKIEETLRKSEQMLSTHLLNTPIGAISWDLDFKTVEWNPAAESIFGYSKAEAMGKHVTDLILPEEMKEMVEGIFQDILSGKGGACNINENITKSGKRIRCDWYNTALKDTNGRTIGMASLVNDITERLQTEEALQESENRFRDISLSMADYIWEIDSEFKFTYISQSIKDVLGYAPKELIGKIPFDLMPENESVRVKAIVSKIVSKSENIKDLENWNIDKAGHWVLMLTSGIPILDNEGKTKGYRGVNKNITAQRKLETQLQQSQKMESIGTLTGGVAHDFNNILGIIVGNTELALTNVPEWNPAHANLKEIKTASLRAANIVKQLLSFSRKTDQKLQPIEIGKVIKDTLHFLRSTIPTTIDIKQDIFVTHETILADPTQINQIMMNLCINASHAMEQTGGTLIITVQKVTLDDKSAQNYPDLKSGNHVKIMVGDTGPGINPKTIDRIFEPYFTTKEIGKGTGLGLAVVHGIVKSNGGGISVDSRLGKGSTFTILFPLAQETAVVEEKKFQEIPRGSETILFVDDEISILNMVQQMFEHLGYRVETAITPQDALDRFAINPDHFDLVITDMTMPQMTGVNLSKKLLAIRPDIPIILCTGHSALVDEEKAKEFGLAAYVMKPINMRETAETIRKLLDNR